MLPTCELRTEIRAFLMVDSFSEASPKAYASSNADVPENGTGFVVSGYYEKAGASFIVLIDDFSFFWESRFR